MFLTIQPKSDSFKFPSAVFSSFPLNKVVHHEKGVHSRRSLNDDLSLYPDFPGNQQYSSRIETERSRVVDAGEARQVEALEIADSIGGDTRMVHNVLGNDGEAAAGGAEIAERQALLLQKKIESVKANNSDSLSVRKGVGYTNRVITTTIKQVFSDGQVKELTVDAARKAFLELMSDGLESQDIEISNVSEEKAWWDVDLDTIRSVEIGLPDQSQQMQRLSSTTSRGNLYRTIDHGKSQTEENGRNTASKECKIAVLDVANDIGPAIGARSYDLSHKRVWPFGRRNFGIDGVATLFPEHYQYSNEYWISRAIRSSERYASELENADFIFVDYWTYHLAWLAYVHPLGNRNTTNPERHLRQSLAKILQSERYVCHEFLRRPTTLLFFFLLIINFQLMLSPHRFTRSKGNDFAFVHPSPIMKNLFTEEVMCEDLASALNMVPERSSLCVWTPDSALEGKSLLLPYLATLDLDLDKEMLDSNGRDIFIFFRGGCGHPGVSVRALFAAGKMMRYELVTYLKSINYHPKGRVIAECSCDICDNKMPHPTLMQSYRQSQFCPVMPSNVQSSRRLSEVVLAGCIPVFFGPPFHTLPLAQYVKYADIGIFFNISQSVWVNESSPNYLQNRLINRVWRLDDPSIEQHLIYVANFKEAVEYLGQMSAEEIAAKRKAVLSERWKFYYGPLPVHAGGDGESSQLVDILMDEMCLRAATSREYSMSQNETRN